MPSSTARTVRKSGSTPKRSSSAKRKRPAAPTAKRAPARRAIKANATRRTAAKASATKSSAAKRTAAKKTAAKRSVSKRSAAKTSAARTQKALRSAARTQKAVARASKSQPASPRELPVKRSARKATRGSADQLATYNQKRRFDVTPEPRGQAVVSTEHELTFVVQKHAASHLHYDFRLELDGVLLSWSVPKGPSLRAGERRLAVRTEDHPLDYAAFEGVIPKGEYGGGSVIVWDRGVWRPEGDVHKELARGRLTFTLAGEKLSGRFHLVRSKLGQNKRENWLLFKGRDQSAHDDLDIVSERPESVLSGKTVEEIGEPDVRDVKEAQPEPVADMVEMVSRLSPGFSLTNLDKVLYPEQGLRKAEIIAYYVSVASVMLPYVQNRPLVLVRCPHGRGQKCFYQKHIDKGVPDALRRVRIKESGKSAVYSAIDDMSGLIALAQMGVLEIHLWGCHADQVEKPDVFVFDIDPDESLGFDPVVETALELRDTLAELGLTSFVKTTGGKGLHVVAPVARHLTWEQHKAVSHAIVENMARARPDRYLTNMRKDLRKGKIFLDYLRNGRGATAIAPYSTRAREGAHVATPLRWDELTRGVHPSDFDVRSVLRRLEDQRVDPWRGFNELEQALPAALVKSLTRSRAA